jgi:hypothetical protein
MAERPSGWGRMRALWQGQVSAEALEAYRRAGPLVAEVMDRVQARRLACAVDGLDPWSIPPATRAALLCAWNAFVLQTLGSELLDADYAADPASAGFVPPAAADEAMAYFADVEGWLDRANQAEANPDFRLDVPVPADLPWHPEAPSPMPHLQGLLGAMETVGARAAAAIALLPETASGGTARQEQLDRIRHLYGEARRKAENALHAADPSHRGREGAEAHARAAIELFHEVGQLVADPTLTVGAAGEASGTMPPLPGERGFDPRVLSAPAAREWIRTNPRAREAIDRLWALDPHPARTLGIHAEIAEAVERGYAVYATDRRGARLAPWFRCPWSPVYEARRRLRLGGVLLLRGEQFVYDVGASPDGDRAGFTRRVRPGPVHPTRTVQYLDSAPAADSTSTAASADPPTASSPPAAG